MKWRHTLHCLIWYIYSANCHHGLVLLLKTNLSDVFYKFHLTPRGVLRLAKPFINLPGEPPLVTIPTQLSIGWTESPPAFSAITKRMAYFIKKSIETLTSMPTSHPFEDKASTTVTLIISDPEPHPIIDSAPMRPTLDYTDVSVNVFCKLAQWW